MSEKEQVIDIIAESFRDNPSVLSVIKNGHRQEKRIRHLASYAYETAKQRDGILLSSDGLGALISYKYNFKKEGLKDYWQQLLLVLRVTGIQSIPTLLRREAYLKAQRPSDGEFLYVWFLGVKDIGKGKSAVKELRDFIFSQSEDLQLPIYIETTVPINKVVYERYGFETYHEWSRSHGFIVYFMRREPNKKGS